MKDKNNEQIGFEMLEEVATENILKYKGFSNIGCGLM